MVHINAFALASGLIALVKATSIETPVAAQVGKLITLKWELAAGDYPSQLMLQYGNGDLPYTCKGCQALQFETLVEWDNSVEGVSSTSIDWIPNMPGPAFFIQFKSNHGAAVTQMFEILAADGSEVTVAVPVERHSNLRDQTATGLWYPNDPHKTIAATTTSVTSTASDSTVTPTPEASATTIIVVATTTPAATPISTAKGYAAPTGSQGGYYNETVTTLLPSKTAASNATTPGPTMLTMATGGAALLGSSGAMLGAAFGLVGLLGAL